MNWVRLLGPPHTPQSSSQNLMVLFQSFECEPPPARPF